MKNTTKQKMSGADIFKKYGIVAVLAVLVIVFTAITPTFIQVNNLLEILRQVAFQGIIAVGMTLCLITGNMDLSVGSIVAFGGMIAALFMAAMPIPFAAGAFNPNPIVGSILGILAGTFWGFVNGFFVNQLKITPFIVTLATMEMVRGIVYIFTGALPIYDGIEDYFRVLGQGSIGMIPIPVIIMIVVFVIGGLVLSKTVYGRHVYCVGGNEEVARLSGIKVKKIKYSVFVINGALCGLAGIMLLSRMNSLQPRIGTGYEFEIITACVLGGVSIAGGEGKMFGTFIGVLIMGVLFNGLIQVGLNEFYQLVIKGAVLLIAVGMDAMSQMKKESLASLLKKEKSNEANEIAGG